MTYLLSRVLSGAKQAILHPVDTFQNVTQVGSQLVTKTKEVTKRVFSEKITVYGVDVNVAAKSADIASSLLAKAHIIEPQESEIGDVELRELMGSTRQVIDEKIQAASDSIIDTTNDDHLVTTDGNLEIDSPEIISLRETEAQSRNLLIKHLLNFSSITWFDQKIYGETRGDSIEFYRHLVSQNPSDPLASYYKILWEKSAFYYSLATLFIPISEWFIELFINPVKGIKGGITNAKEVFNNYFKDSEHTRQEISELFKVSKNYFYKLFALYQSFAAVKKDPLHPDHCLTLKEYLDKKLKEDISILDRPPKELCKRFNTTLVNLFSPKSGIPVLGSLIDPILKMILSLAVDSIDPINKLLSSSFGSSASNVTFNYKVAALIESHVRKLHENLLASQVSQTRQSTKEEVRIRSASSVDSISDEEKVLIEDFVSNLLKFLPLEGLQENQVEEALKPKEGSSLFNLSGKVSEKIHDLAENSIEKTLQSFGVDLFGMLTNNSWDREEKIKLWTDVLNLGVGFFSEPGIARTTQDLISIRSQARNAFKDLLNTALDFHFHDSSLKQSLETNKTKTDHIISGIKHNSTKFNEKIVLIQAQLHEAIEDKNLDLLRKLNSDLLIEIKDFFTSSQLTTEEALSFSGIDQDAKKEIKIASKRITLEVNSLLEIHSGLEDIIHRLSIDLPLHASTLSLLSESELSESCTKTILPRKTPKFLSDQLSFIRSKQREFVNTDYEIKIEVIALAYVKIHEISELNRQIDSKIELAQLLSKTQLLLLENLNLKQAIEGHPKKDEIITLQEKIKDLHSFVLDLSSKSTDDEEYASDISVCFLDLQENLKSYQVDDESLQQLECFLKSPKLGEIKENARLINVAFKNLETKLLNCPKEDLKAFANLTKNNKKLQQLHTQLTSQDIRCSLQSPINSIDEEEANLVSINALIDENNISIQLLMDQKIWHQTQLAGSFTEINGQKEAQIDRTWNEALIAYNKLAPSFSSISESASNIKVKEVYLAICPFDKRIANFQKSTAKPIFEGITDKLLDVVLDPRHREQLLFRSALASNGSLSRIMPS